MGEGVVAELESVAMKHPGHVRVAHHHAADLEERRGHVLGEQYRGDLRRPRGVGSVVERQRDVVAGRGLV